MRILHISHHDQLNSAYRLHTAMRRLGHDSVMFVGDRRQADPTVVVFRPSTDTASRVRRHLRGLRIRRAIDRYRSTRPSGLYDSFSNDRTIYGGEILSQLPPADAIILHAVLRLVDIGAFFRSVPSGTPVVRALHDMSFFTGGCHVDAGCGRYARGCGACPQLGSRDPDDLSHGIWERKRAAIQAVDPARLHVVSPSRWLAEAAAASPIARGLRVSVIPHGSDPEVFAPRDRGLARDVLGLPRDARVVTFVAEPITRPVKRLRNLVAAIEMMPAGVRPILVTVGNGGPNAAVSVPHLHLGSVRNERLLSLVYSAGDVMAVPSHQEAFSLVTLEAGLCGIPVVGSAAGGIPEIVRHGTTGLIVPPDDVPALSTGLRDLLIDHQKRLEMGAAARSRALEEYTLELMARRYVEVCEQMLGMHAAARTTSDAPIHTRTGST